jgi:hypothetical protein
VRKDGLISRINGSQDGCLTKGGENLLRDNRGLSGKYVVISRRGEVPKEKATVEPIRALEDQYGDRRLAVRRHEQLKKWSWGDGGSQKKMAATCTHDLLCHSCMV